jgi:hypothetical protein
MNFLCYLSSTDISLSCFLLFLVVFPFSEMLSMLKLRSFKLVFSYLIGLLALTLWGMVVLYFVTLKRKTVRKDTLTLL